MAADYLVFVFLYYGIHTGTAIAAPVGLTVGFVSNFILNKLWSFSSRMLNSKQVLKQAVFYVSLVIFNSFFTYLFIEWMKNMNLLEPKFSKLLATAIITLWNYIIYKRIIFKSED